MENSFINNKCPEGYAGLKTLYIAGKISKFHGELNDIALLNGIEVLIEDIPEFPRTKYIGTTLVYNKPDESVYIVSRFMGGLDERAADSLAHTIIDMWPRGKFDVNTEELPGVFVEFPDFEEVIPSLLPLSPPKGYSFLGSVFVTPELQLMYEEFMTDPFIYSRLLKMCKVRGIPVKPEMDNSAALPIHKKDQDTGELLVSDRVLKVFNQYQFSRNYLDGFDAGTAEHDLGKILRLDQKFCEYMMNRAAEALKGKELSEELYMQNVNQAIGRIQKNAELMNLFINNLGSPAED